MLRRKARPGDFAFGASASRGTALSGIFVGVGAVSGTESAIARWASRITSGEYAGKSRSEAWAAVGIRRVARAPKRTTRARSRRVRIVFPRSGRMWGPYNELIIT